MTRRCAPTRIEAAPAVARRGASRAGQLLSLPVGPRDYKRVRRHASGDGVDASFGPSAVLRTVWTSHGEADASPPLAHTRRSRAYTLAASATTIHVKGNFAGTGPRPDCSVIPGTPSPEQSGQIPGGSTREYEKQQQVPDSTSARNQWKDSTPSGRTAGARARDCNGAFSSVTSYGRAVERKDLTVERSLWKASAPPASKSAVSDVSTIRNMSSW